MSRRRSSGALLLAGIVGAACSVINSYDDVVPADGAGGSGGQSGGTGGSNEGGTGNTGEAGGGPEPMGGAGAGGAGIVAPDSGLIVLGGTTLDGSEDVVVAVDPETGAELNRITLQNATPVGIAYDGTNGRDTWFLFTATEFPADPASRADLQIRRFVDATGTWSNPVRVPALPPPRPDSFVVLNDRLAYLSYTAESGGVVDSLTILDTTDLDAVSRIDLEAIDFGGDLLGLVGTRGTPDEPTALGGTLAAVVGVGCAGDGALRTCTALNLLPVFVGAEVSTGVASPYPAFGGIPASTSARTEQLAFAAVPAAAPGQSLRILRFDARSPDDVTISPVAASRARWVGGLVYAECQGVALFTSVVEGQLYAVTPQGLTVNLALGRRGQQLVYDPFTQRVFAPYNPSHAVFGGADGAGGAGGAGGASGDADALIAVDPVRSGASVTIARAPDWTSPTDVAPNVIGARFPSTFECP